MAKERKYGWNGELLAKDASGQCKIVYDALRAEPDAVRTGHEWDAVIGASLKTKQDTYRVVLYYILILKGKGVVRTAEYDIEATTKNEDGKHGITVKTNSEVGERALVETTV